MAENRLLSNIGDNMFYHRPGDKRQLKSQDVTAKLVRFDILTKVPTTILFCITLAYELKIPEGRTP